MFAVFVAGKLPGTYSACIYKSNDVTDLHVNDAKPQIDLPDHEFEFGQETGEVYVISRRDVRSITLTSIGIYTYCQSSDKRSGGYIGIVFVAFGCCFSITALRGIRTLFDILMGERVLGRSHAENMSEPNFIAEMKEKMEGFAKNMVESSFQRNASFTKAQCPEEALGNFSASEATICIVMKKATDNYREITDIQKDNEISHHLRVVIFIENPIIRRRIPVSESVRIMYLNEEGGLGNSNEEKCIGVSNVSESNIENFSQSAMIISSDNQGHESEQPHGNTKEHAGNLRAIIPVRASIEERIEDISKTLEDISNKLKDYNGTLEVINQQVDNVRSAIHLEKSVKVEINVSDKTFKQIVCLIAIASVMVVIASFAISKMH